MGLFGRISIEQVLSLYMEFKVPIARADFSKVKFWVDFVGILLEIIISLKIS